MTPEEIDQGQACRNLIAAVMAQAVSEFRSSKHWIIDRSNHTFSFVWCCIQLDVDPDITRAKIIERCDVHRGIHRASGPRRKK